jgi:hypothetical protein
LRHSGESRTRNEAFVISSCFNWLGVSWTPVFTGITTHAIEKQIAKLQKNKQLKRIGPTKGGRWEVMDG